MPLFPGTSIGFKNIASKIANELKLWLPSSGPRRRRRRRPTPPDSSSDRDTPPPVPPLPPPRTDSLRLSTADSIQLSTEDIVKLANGGQRTPSGTLAHFLATDYMARSDYRIPHLKSKNTYLSPDEQVLAKSDYLRPHVSPKRSTYLTANEITLAKSDYLRAPSPKQPRSSLSLKADSVEVRASNTLRPRVQHQSYSYSVHTLRRQARVSPPMSPPLPCDCLPTEPIPPPELFDFWKLGF